METLYAIDFYEINVDKKDVFLVTIFTLKIAIQFKMHNLWKDMQKHKFQQHRLFATLSPPWASGRQGEQGPDQPNATHAMLQPAANRCVNNTSDVPNNAFNNEPGCNNLEQK